MIEFNDKVRYIGTDSRLYIDADTGIGKTGRVISEPYQLSSVPGLSFVDVEWHFDPIPDLKKVLISDAKAGHVVNVSNLKKLD